MRGKLVDGIKQGSVFAFRVGQLVGEQVSASPARTTLFFAQFVTSQINSRTVREQAKSVIFREFCKLAYFRGYFEKYPECKRIFREKFAKSLRKVCEKFAQFI